MTKRSLLLPLTILILSGAAAPNAERVWQRLRRENTAPRAYSAAGRLAIFKEPDTIFSTTFQFDWRRSPEAFRLVMVNPGGDLYAVLNLNGDTLRAYNFRQKYVYVMSKLYNFRDIVGIDFVPGQIGTFFFPDLPKRPDSVQTNDSNFVFFARDRSYSWDRRENRPTGMTSGSDTLFHLDYVPVGKTLRPSQVVLHRGTTGGMSLTLQKQTMDPHLEPMLFQFGVGDTAKYYDLR